MNFRRGKQMIVHDPGLNIPPPSGSPPNTQPTPLIPPVAYRRWTVHPQNSLEFILEGIGRVANDTDGGLDAVHFMAHGSPGGMDLGRDGVERHNADHFKALRGLVRFIVFFSCSVGGEHRGGAWYRYQDETIGQQLVAATGASIVVAQETQYYNFLPQNRIMDFGAWEGPVDVYEPGSSTTHNAPNPFRREPQIDLERLIFGNHQ